MGIAFLLCCAPARDTVLKDVERNYTAAGFLDTDTFQVICPLGEGERRLEACAAKLIAELTVYKERYDRESYQRRTHTDFQPFIQTAGVSDETRQQWRVFYTSLAEKHSRIVFETQTEGVYRLRLRDLIYRVQKLE